MLPHLRAFLVVSEEGSINRAATRLRTSQSALSRQIQALEHEMGGALFERSSSGITLTPGGIALRSKMRTVLADYDRAVMEVRRIVRGEQDSLRIGYLPSIGKEYLELALKHLRAVHPEVVVKLLDLSPGEQITAVRAGAIELGLTNESAELLSREFYVRELMSVASVVALPERHPLSRQSSLRLAQLKGEMIVTGDEGHVPGLTRRVAELCWKYGRFRPRFFGPVAGIGEAFQAVANDSAVALFPNIVRNHTVPGVVMLPLAEAAVTWKIMVFWQRGKASPALRVLLGALFKKA